MRRDKRTGRERKGKNNANWKKEEIMMMKKKKKRRERIQSKQKHREKLNKRKEHFRNEALKETIGVG